MRFNDIPCSTSNTKLSCTFEDFEIRVKSIEDDRYDPYNSMGFNPIHNVTMEFVTSDENTEALIEIFQNYNKTSGCTEALHFDMILMDKTFSDGIITEIRTPPYGPTEEPETTFTVVFSTWEEHGSQCSKY